MAETTGLRDRSGRGPTGSVKVMVWKSAAGFVTVGAVIGLAGCSSGLATRSGSTGAASSTVLPNTMTTSTAATTKASRSDGVTQPAVLNAWESAQQTLYAYMQQPWPQIRADLVAGENSADLWPKLANYFSNPALQSEGLFLIGVKMEQLNGPAAYNLGHPVVTSETATTATVTGCIFDTGTTTAAGAPGPRTLGGLVGGASGWWNLELLAGSWRITTFRTTSVPQC